MIVVVVVVVVAAVAVAAAGVVMKPPSIVTWLTYIVSLSVSEWVSILNMSAMWQSVFSIMLMSVISFCLSWGF
jgi:hypothetical protein